MKKKAFLILTVILFFGVFSMLLFYSKDVADFSKASINNCLNIIAPTLFPFLVMSSILSNTNITKTLAIMARPIIKPIFNLSGECATPIIMGLLAGYPVGAINTINALNNGQISKMEANQLLFFVNNCGPSFIITFVGGAVLKSVSIGIKLYLIHIVSALFCGILVGVINRKKNEIKSVSKISFSDISFSKAFTTSITSSALQIFNICAFIVFFSVIIGFLSKFGVISIISSYLQPLGVSFDILNSTFKGFIEFSSAFTNDVTIDKAWLCAINVILAFGGLSVHFQTLSVLEGSGIKYRMMLAGKILQSIIAVMLTLIFI